MRWRLFSVVGLTGLEMTIGRQLVLMVVGGARWLGVVSRVWALGLFVDPFGVAFPAGVWVLHKLPDLPRLTNGSQAEALLCIVLFGFGIEVVGSLRYLGALHLLVLS